MASFTGRGKRKGARTRRSCACVAHRTKGSLGRSVASPRLAVPTNEAIDLDGLTRSDRRAVLVDDVHAQFLLDCETMFDLRLLALAFGLRLAATTLVAVLADAHVSDTSAVDHAANVIVLALRGTRVAGFPFAVGVADHARAAVLAPLRGGDDGLLAIHLGLADEDETAGAEVAGVADAIDFVLVLLGGAAENELDAVDVLGANHRHVPAGLASLLLVATRVEMNDAELVVVAILPSPAVGQLVLGLEHCDDRSDDLFLGRLDWNQCQGCQLLVADDLHFSVLSVWECACFEPE